MPDSMLAAAKGLRGGLRAGPKAPADGHGSVLAAMRPTQVDAAGGAARSSWCSNIGPGRCRAARPAGPPAACSPVDVGLVDHRDQAYSARRRGSSNNGKQLPVPSLGCAAPAHRPACPRPGSAAVALSHPAWGALVKLGADLGGGLGLRQLRDLSRPRSGTAHQCARWPAAAGSSWPSTIAVLASPISWNRLTIPRRRGGRTHIPTARLLHHAPRLNPSEHLNRLGGGLMSCPHAGWPWQRTPWLSGKCSPAAGAGPAADPGIRGRCWSAKAPAQTLYGGRDRV